MDAREGQDRPAAVTDQGGAAVLRRREPAAPVDLDQELLVPAGDHLRLVMVASLDGASSIDGRVGALTGPLDQRVLATTREVADVVLVGAGTVRAEGYGPLTCPPAVRSRRVARSQSADPGLAVVTARGDLDPDHDLFRRATTRPLVVTVASCPRLERLARVADVVLAGSGELDLGLALAGLRARGLHRISVEGGARLNAALLRDDHVDELLLSTAPLLVGGAPGIVAGPGLRPPRRARLTAVYGAPGRGEGAGADEGDQELLLTRWSLR